VTQSPAQVWTLIALLTLVTLVARNLFLLLPPAWQPRPQVAEALRYAPLAALLAITAPEIVRDVRGLPLAPALLADPRLAAAVVLTAALLLSRRSLLALVLGSTTFLLLGLLRA
jgi:branched-subunit amino acid transport protein